MPGALTDRAIKAAIERKKACKLFDGGGLYLHILPPKATEKPPAASRRASKRQVTPSTRWRHKYYFDGDEKLISHGIYPRVTLQVARKRWAAAKALLA